MHDVVVIGGGHAGMAIADSCHKAGLAVAVIEECCPKPEWWAGEWVQGRGAVVSPGVVVALDAETADERRMMQCRAIVIAIGRMDPESHSSHLLGITKLGAVFTPDNSQIQTEATGRTGAPGIYAAGSCASSATPNIVSELLRAYGEKLDQPQAAKA